MRLVISAGIEVHITGNFTHKAAICLHRLKSVSSVTAFSFLFDAFFTRRKELSCKCREEFDLQGKDFPDYLKLNRQL